MADKPVGEVTAVDAALDALSSPSASDVYEAMLPFSNDAVAAAAAHRALSGGGGAFSGVSVVLAANQTGLTLGYNEETAAVWAAGDYDTDNYFNAGTPSVLTFPSDGIYQVVFACGGYEDSGVDSILWVRIETELSTLTNISSFGPGWMQDCMGVATIVAPFEEGDTITLFGAMTADGGTTWRMLAAEGSRPATYATITRLGDTPA